MERGKSMKQWAKDTYLLNWDDACEKAKNYSEEPDQSDKGSWRLPTPEELKDFALIEDKDLSFWTSLEGLSTSTIFYLKHGSMSSVFKRNRIPTIFVREIEEPKLEWQENSPTYPMNWNEANEYAKSLGDGWRLPTVEELKEAYDNNVQGFQSNFYWSSSTYAQSTNDAWFVDFYNGSVYDNIKTLNYYVRCVRNIPKETVREPFWEIRDCLRVQEKSALSDEYNLGLYNGMEFCLAILEKREPKYKDMEPKKPVIPRYRIDVLQNSDKQINGMKYELEESGNWVQYNDIRNLIDNHEHLLFELKKLLRDVK